MNNEGMTLSRSFIEQVGPVGYGKSNHFSFIARNMLSNNSKRDETPEERLARLKVKYNLSHGKGKRKKKRKSKNKVKRSKK